MEANQGLNISFGEVPEHKQHESLISLYTVTQNQAQFSAHMDLTLLESRSWSPSQAYFILGLMQGDKILAVSSLN